MFGVPEAYAAPDVALAAYAYAAQIYCDFSGYTDIAIGVALLMGFVFPQNFNCPYRALSFRDFWRRWHMTLSRFLRDFLYIPLGGNRHGKLQTYRNLMITMVLGGLWHGAAWGFVLWGALHGTALVVEHALRDRGAAPPPAWLAWLIVFNVVVFGWILFRAESLELAGDLHRAAVRPGPATLWAPVTVAAVAVVIGFQLLPPICSSVLRIRLAGLPAPRSAQGSRWWWRSSALRSRARACPRSSTSSSDPRMTEPYYPTSPEPPVPPTPEGPAPDRAPRADRGVPRRAPARAVRGLLDPLGGRGDGPGP